MSLSFEDTGRPLFGFEIHCCISFWSQAPSSHERFQQYGVKKALRERQNPRSLMHYAVSPKVVSFSIEADLGSPHDQMSLGSTESRGLKRRHSQCESLSPTVVTPQSPTVVPQQKLALHSRANRLSSSGDLRKIINEAFDVSDRIHDGKLKELREEIEQRDSQHSITGTELQQMRGALQHTQEELGQVSLRAHRRVHSLSNFGGCLTRHKSVLYCIGKCFPVAIGTLYLAIKPKFVAFVAASQSTRTLLQDWMKSYANAEFPKAKHQLHVMEQRYEAQGNELRRINKQSQSESRIHEQLGQKIAAIRIALKEVGKFNDEAMTCKQSMSDEFEAFVKCRDFISGRYSCSLLPQL